MRRNRAPTHAYVVVSGTCLASASLSVVPVGRPREWVRSGDPVPAAPNPVPASTPGELLALGTMTSGPVNARARMRVRALPDTAPVISEALADEDAEPALGTGPEYARKNAHAMQFEFGTQCSYL